MDLEAINIFDFDGTLTTETWPKFWVWIEKFGYNGKQRNDNLENALEEYRKNKKGSVLETFFGFFNDLLMESGQTLTYKELMEGEKYIQYNQGIVEFLKSSLSKNYIVSGGLTQFLEKLKIANYFEGIYGTQLIHNQEGLIVGIGEVMTDEKKIEAIQEILRQNRRKENDCRNVNYIGDGTTDVAAMRFVHNHGGKAIFVHQLSKEDEFYQYNNKIYQTLNKDGIVDFCCVADYKDGSVLSNLLLGKGQSKQEEFIYE